MFDNAPNNLPVEIPTSPPPAAPMSPALPPPPPPSPSVMTTAASPEKKDPEDIFAGLDRDTETSPLMPSYEPSASGSKQKMILMVVLALVVVAGLGFGVWWMFLRTPATLLVTPNGSGSSNPSVVTADAQPIVEVPPVLPQSDSQVPDIIPPDASNVPLPTTSTITTTEDVPPLPPATPTEGKDTDGDGLTDVEEGLLGTNAGAKDSDGDGYEDLAELKSGYDPAVAKLKLEASPKLHLVSVVSGWKVWLPMSWVVTSDAASPGDVVIQTDSTSVFSVHVGSRGTAQNLDEWLQTNEPTENPITMSSFSLPGGASAMQSNDHLRTYVLAGQDVLTIRHDLKGSSSYEYRALYDYVVHHLSAILR